MSKRSKPVIPDFSRKRPQSKQPQSNVAQGNQLPNAKGGSVQPNRAMPVSVKPQSTSAKSGRRGQ